MPNNGSPPGGGMGNPHEDQYFYEGYRDWGQDESWPKDVVHDPACSPKKVSPEKKVELDAFFCRFKDELKKAIFISKRPAFLEPPFFSRPLMKCRGTVVPGATRVIVLSRPIPDRQRAIVTMLAVATDNPTLVANQFLEFWFSLDDVTVPLFDDQTLGVAQFGRTTIIPGSLENPMNLREHGLAFEVKGPKTLEFNIRNTSLVSVNVRAMMGYYQYWLPEAGEFAQSDLQL